MKKKVALIHTGFALVEALTKFVCCFVPVKRWRKSIRRRIVVNPRLRHQLLSRVAQQITS